MITLVKRLAILLLIQVTTVNFVFADGEGTNDLKTFYNSFLPNFQKLTPEASALGQYGKYGVSSYTGVPNISVPLFTIGSGNFSMPIELSYDASGIKVEQDATYVGLGWNLIMGGCISRIVCGQNDSKETKEAIDNLTNLDIYKYTTQSSISFLNPYSNGNLRADRMTAQGQMMEDISRGSRIPDIFQASFCGHNVSFVIEKDANNNDIAKIISNNATKYKINVYHLNSIEDRVEIVDDHGIQYVFTQTPEANTEDNRLYQLSKIQNAVECLVEFKYTKVTLTLKQHYWETVGMPDKIYTASIDDAIYGQFIRRNYPEKDKICYVINKYYPEEIITKREIVSFTYGDRTDIKGAKEIDKITVKSKNGDLIHTADFKYDYFVESTNPLCSEYNYSSYYDYKRLKLKDVTVDGKKYSFEYNEASYLPSRLSKSQDFWGYYNGENKDQNSEFCSAPQYLLNGEEISECESVGTAVRYASKELCKLGTISKITYPTGGYTKFDFEVHHFNDVNCNYYYPASESEIKKDTTVSIGGVACEGGSTVKNDDYFSKENMFYIPIEQDAYLEYDVRTNDQNLSASVELYDCTNEENLLTAKTGRQTIGAPKGLIHLKEGWYKLIATLKHKDYVNTTSASISIKYTRSPKIDKKIKDGDSYSIGGGLRINKIENYDSNNKLIDYTQYKYEGGKLLVPTVKTNHISLWYGFGYIGSNAQGQGSYPNYKQCFFYFVSSDSSYPEICSLGSPNVGYTKITKEHYNKNMQRLSYDVEIYNNEGYNTQWYKEDITIEESNAFCVNRDGLNGKIKSFTTYSNDDIIMRKINYAYTTFDKPQKIEDVVFFPWCRMTFSKPDGLTRDYKYRFFLYPKYLTNVLPSTVTETNYVNGVAMKPVTTTFEYNANNYQQAKVTKTVELNSKTKDVVTTQYWYPNDSEVSNSNPSYLTKVNCISEVVKAKTFKNGNIVGGYRNFYGALSNNLPVVKKNYSIDTSNSENLELDVINYDNYGNIREYKKKDGTPVTVIWAYNHQFPVMEIVGQTYSQVKTIYTSLTYLEEKYTTSEEIEKSIEALHKALLNKKIMATAYEYSPWHTVKRIIKPNGYIVNYGYDSFGRLAETKDASGILQKYSYNYKNK